MWELKGSLYGILKTPVACFYSCECITHNAINPLAGKIHLSYRGFAKLKVEETLKDVIIFHKNFNANTSKFPCYCYKIVHHWTNLAKSMLSVHKALKMYIFRYNYKLKVNMVDKLPLVSYNFSHFYSVY